VKNLSMGIILLFISIAVMTGCSSNKEKEIPAYFSAKTVPLLQVPEDLDRPQRASAMQLPEAAFQQQFPADTDVEGLLKPPHIIDDSES